MCLYVGEYWKTDVERESRVHSSKSNSDLAEYLHDYLKQRYPGVSWMVIVYDDVTGYQIHTYRGVSPIYSLFRHYGHNIIVTRLIYGSPPSQDLGNLLEQSYRKREDCSWWSGCELNAEHTVDATWNVLDDSVTPRLLHVVCSNVDVSAAWYFDSRYVASKSLSGAFVTLIATA